MKRFLLALLILVTASAGSVAQRRGGGGSRSSRSATSSSKPKEVHVKGYTRKDGTRVEPYVRTAPDGNFNNNWSTKGNVNPYTGKEGTRVSPSSTLGRTSSADSVSTDDGTVLNTPNQDESQSNQLARPTPQRTTALRERTLPPPEPPANGATAPTLPNIQIAVVIRLKANLRDSPGHYSAVVQEVSEGNAVVLSNERTGGWYKVTDVITGKEGWIHGNVIRIAFAK